MGLAFGVGLGAQAAAGHDLGLDQAGCVDLEAVADQFFVDGGRLVARLEGGHVDGVAVRAHGQRAGRVGEEAHDLERHAAQRVAQGRGVEHPHVGAADTFGGETRIASAGHALERRVGALLAAVGGGDEGAGWRAREDDVARFIADQQGAHDAGRTVQADHAHAVRQVVDDPDLVVGARGHGHGLQAHGHAGEELQTRGRDVEDVERVVRRVDSEQARAVGRLRDRAHVAAFEGDEAGGRGLGRARRGAAHREQGGHGRAGEQTQRCRPAACALGDVGSHGGSPRTLFWTAFSVTDAIQCKEVCWRR